MRASCAGRAFTRRQSSLRPRPLTELVPIAKTKNDEIVTAYDMKAVEKMGLLKMDFLGLTTLTVIDDCLKLIEQSRGEKLDIETIPPADEETFKKVFHSGAHVRRLPV